MKSFKDYLAEAEDIEDLRGMQNDNDDSPYGMAHKWHGFGYCPSDARQRAQELAKAMGLNYADLGITMSGGARRRFSSINTVPTKFFKENPSKGHYSDGQPVADTIEIPVNLYTGAEREAVTDPKAPQPAWERLDGEDPGVGCEADLPLGAKHPLRGNTLQKKSTSPADKSPGSPTTGKPSAKSDPKVRELQDRILAKDPKALPRFGADGIMGKETRAAMQRLGIQESLELQRILDLVKI